MPSPGEQPGVGPAPEPWPDDPRLDPELLAEGDRRNVADRYRYWRLEAIVADLDERRHPFHVAVENWRARPQHRRGRAQRERVPRRRGPHRRRPPLEPPRRDGHRPLPARPPPPDAGGLRATGRAREELPVLGVDNLPGSVAIDGYELPRRCVLLFGQEGPGLSEEARALSRGGARDPPVRLHPLDQRGGRERGRDARVGAAPCGAAGAVASRHAPARPEVPGPAPDARLDRAARPVHGALPRPLRRRVHPAHPERGHLGDAQRPGRGQAGLHRRPAAAARGRGERDPAPDPRPELGAAARRRART